MRERKLIQTVDVFSNTSINNIRVIGIFYITRFNACFLWDFSSAHARCIATEFHTSIQRLTLRVEAHYQDRLSGCRGRV